MRSIKIAVGTLITVVLILLSISCGAPRNPGSTKEVSKRVVSQKREAPTPPIRKVTGKKSNIIKMGESGGVYSIPVTVNGKEMDFIFDTGASNIVISSVEALFLYKQGCLSEDDFMGVNFHTIADGSVTQGYAINLRTVTIGSKTLKNVKASVIENPAAPLLVGQSALSQFGAITIDYKNKTIQFSD